MNYTWYFIFERSEFEADGLVSRTYVLNLDGIGQKNVLVTQGELLGITYEGVFVALGLNEKNPFEMDGFAIFEDDRGVWLGIAEA